MEQIVEETHYLLGTDTRDISNLKLYVVDYEGRPYIQSNYLAPTVENRSLRHIHPTKLLLDKGQMFSLDMLLYNILFPETQRSPTAQEIEVIRAAMKSVVVYLDASALAHDGRPASGLNLMSVSEVSVVHNYQPIGSGKFSVLKLASPPLPSSSSSKRGFGDALLGGDWPFTNA
ncbi:hypothetical protein ACQ86G_17240 [Roseateles chitinivorans]|uniref:hypothetical protein n=1 Tax=Roseateles chitinivorans TaxID=2917965 RepID=UPI003D66B8EF